MFNTEKELQECLENKHRVVWENKNRWRGVYPRTIKGICLDCDKYYSKIISNLKEELNTGTEVDAYERKIE